MYRRSDDPALTAKNEDTFEAVTAALADGAAIAIFPEGTSHDAPALAPFKTGAARIALGAAAAGIPLAIVPVGLVLADRDRARSEALAVLGPPVQWDDLRAATPASAEAVRELTARTAAALSAVTLNLDAWADEPLVTTAEAIYAATHEVSPDPAERVRRLWVATQWLRTLRQSGDPRYPPIAARGEGARQEARPDRTQPGRPEPAHRPRHRAPLERPPAAAPCSPARWPSPDCCSSAGR